MLYWIHITDPCGPVSLKRITRLSFTNLLLVNKKSHTHLPCEVTLSLSLCTSAPSSSQKIGERTNTHSFDYNGSTIEPLLSGHPLLSRQLSKSQNYFQ